MQLCLRVPITMLQDCVNCNSFTMRMLFFFDYNVSITKEYIIITFPKYMHMVLQKNCTKSKLQSVITFQKRVTEAHGFHQTFRN